MDWKLYPRSFPLSFWWLFSPRSCSWIPLHVIKKLIGFYVQDWKAIQYVVQILVIFIMLGYFESSSNCHKRMWWRFIKTPFQFMIVKFAKHQDNKFWYHHTKDFENTQVNIGTNLTYCSYLNMDQISHALSLKVKSMSIKLYISICVLHFKKLNKTNTLHTPI